MVHATIHAAKAPVRPGPICVINAMEVPTLGLSPGEWLPLPVNFEAVATALEQLPRMYFEPDGSFVWVADADATSWQLDGQLQDRGDCLDHVEIKGTCAAAAFAVLLDILRGSAERLVFQLVQEAAFVDEATAIRLVSPPALT